MASRRTRLKASKTPGSSETRHAGRRAARLSVSKRKSTSTPSGPKAVKRLKTNADLNLKKSSASLNLKKEVSSKQTKSKTKKNTPNLQDAYEFNESDEFINGLGDSFLFTPVSKSSRQKVPKKVTKKGANTVTLTKVRFQSNKKPNTSKVARKGKKDELSSLSKSVKAVREKRERKKVSDQSQKKTSTPLLSESVNSASTEKQGSSLSRVRRSPRIIIPRLNLDLSVTPILPIANGTPVSQGSRVRTKKLEGNDPNVDSFLDAQKSPQKTPSCPGEKVERRASLRRAAVTVQTSESRTPTGTACVSKMRVVSKVSVVVEKKDLKRKQSDTKPLEVKAAISVTSTSIKRQKPAQSQLMEKKQNQGSAKVSSSAAKSLNLKSKQQAYLKLASEKTAASLSSKSFTRPRKPAPKSKPVQQEDAADNEVETSSSLPDSGISFGSDSASSRATDASGTPSLPGFMEDEPLQSDLQDLSSPLFSSPNFESTSTSAKDPDSILNKSSSKGYNLKTGKAKREKGRYSIAKVDAWASATNQSLDELESFELVVE